MAKLVLLDPDLGFARALSNNLRARSIPSEYFPNFVEFTLSSREFAPDAFVLDLYAPGLQSESRSAEQGSLLADAPSMTGLLNLKKLRGLFGPSPQVWMLARHGGPDASTRCLESGADLVLYKGPEVNDTAEDIAFAWRTLLGSSRRRETQRQIRRSGEVSQAAN